MQENPRKNRQDRQIMFRGSTYLKEISQQCTLATHTEAVHCQRVLLGVFHRCLWPLKAPGSTFGGGSPSLSSAQTPVPPFWSWKQVFNDFLSFHQIAYLLHSTLYSTLNNFNFKWSKDQPVVVYLSWWHDPLDRQPGTGPAQYDDSHSCQTSLDVPAIMSTASHGLKQLSTNYC